MATCAILLCAIFAFLDAGCGGESGPDPTIKAEAGKTPEASIQATRGPVKQPPAPVQRTKGGPG